MDGRLRNFFYDVKIFDCNGEERKKWVAEIKPFITGISISVTLGMTWNATLSIRSDLRRMIDKFLVSDWCVVGNRVSMRFGYLTSTGKVLSIGNRQWISPWYTGWLKMPDISLGPVSSLTLNIDGVGKEDGLLIQKLSYNKSDLDGMTRREIAGKIAEANNMKSDFEVGLDGVLDEVLDDRYNLDGSYDLKVLQQIAEDIHGEVVVLPVDEINKSGIIKFVSMKPNENEVVAILGFFKKSDINTDPPILVMNSFSSTKPIFFYMFSPVGRGEIRYVETGEKKTYKKDIDVKGSSDFEKSMGKDRGSRTLRLNRGASSQEDANAALADLAKESLPTAGMSAELSPGVPWLLPWHRIKVVGLSNILFDDEYQIRQTNFEIGEDGFSTNIDCVRTVITDIGMAQAVQE